MGTVKHDFLAKKVLIQLIIKQELASEDFYIII